ncbi:hypothetical protein LMG9673_03230 [Ralstonia pseudosolanacearum]|nr:hypothetical protein LMG9673_03230 [Ralstonia pseudosolanacearum]
MAPINEAFGRRARDVWDRFVIDLAHEDAARAGRSHLPG